MHNNINIDEKNKAHKNFSFSENNISSSKWTRIVSFIIIIL